MFWIGFLLVTIIVPLIVLWFRRNFLVLLISYAPFLGYTYTKIHPACVENHASEACTWGYMNYMIALVAGTFVYFVLSALQAGYLYLKNQRAA